MAFTFRLYLENGEDVGAFSTAVPNWRVGDEFFSGDHTRFRILNIVDDEDLGSEAEFNGLFVVTPLKLSAARLL